MHPRQRKHRWRHKAYRAVTSSSQEDTTQTIFNIDFPIRKPLATGWTLLHRQISLFRLCLCFKKLSTMEVFFFILWRLWRWHHRTKLTFRIIKERSTKGFVSTKVHLFEGWNCTIEYLPPLVTRSNCCRQSSAFCAIIPCSVVKMARSNMPNWMQRD